jgi:hypothetical protein
MLKRIQYDGNRVINQHATLLIPTYMLVAAGVVHINKDNPYFNIFKRVKLCMGNQQLMAHWFPTMVSDMDSNGSVQFLLNDTTYEVNVVRDKYDNLYAIPDHEVPFCNNEITLNIPECLPITMTYNEFTGMSEIKGSWVFVFTDNDVKTSTLGYVDELSAPRPSEKDFVGSYIYESDGVKQEITQWLSYNEVTLIPTSKSIFNTVKREVQAFA